MVMLNATGRVTAESIMFNTMSILVCRRETASIINNYLAR